MSHAVIHSNRYASGQKVRMCVHLHKHTHTYTYIYTHPDSKSIFWHNSRTEEDLIYCGNDRVKLYMRYRIEFWCWDFSALMALSVSLTHSPSLPLSTTLTSLHPLPRHMPKATTTINMIGPSHKGRRAIIWTGMTRGKWNWFQVYHSVWVYCMFLRLSVCVCVCVLAFGFFH